MKRIYFVLIILSLIGLGAVQYRFFILSLQLTNTKFTIQVTESLGLIGKYLYLETPLTTLMAAGFKEKTPDNRPNQYLKASRDQLEIFLRKRFEKVGVKADFAFAIYDAGDYSLILSSDNYLPDKKPDFSISLDGFLPYQCSCPLNFNLQIKNLIQYFLAESKSIYLPAIIFIVLLLAGSIGAFVVYEQVQFEAKSKQDFYNFLTHELKTPVFTISIASKILENYQHNEKSQEALEIIKTENNKLKIQIERILEMVTTNKLHPILEKENINAPDFFKELVKDFSNSISHDPSILFTHQVEQSNRFFPGDRHHLYHVFLNLLENAGKFRTGLVNINLMVTYVRDQIIIEISDNGWGMESKFKKLIFKPFYRIKQEQHVPGYGLGLSYCKKMMKLHKGKLLVTSQFGKGSIFTVVLPLIKN